ncbi:hypothetical protein Nepgr_020801 [Nepenthes gracilis]|uniref:Uncharacterized protein n=1 Tax=Nepenthes gracilis TaxID=150966 RepID=A0AAD3XWL4_NEPGR|nr:hypothetical protein Nepgr_020801 [Nepenthes gracilis]
MPKNYAEERFAGGKFMKYPAKKIPFTPYDRPLNQPRRVCAGWMSKIVDGAYSFIAGGANRLIQCLFSSSLCNPFSSPLLHPYRTPDGTTIQGNCSISAVNFGFTLTWVHISKSTRGEGRGELHQTSEISDSGLSKFELLIKGNINTFEREEINHLVEKLQSKVTDAKQGRNVDGTTEVDGMKISTETPRIPAIEERPAYLNMIQEEIDASPVEIAKAYMGSQKSGTSSRYKCSTPGDKRLSLYKDKSAAKRTSSSPFLRSAICWPGAITEDDSAFSTRRGRGLYGLPRIPYSRTEDNSKSKIIDNHQSVGPIRRIGDKYFPRSFFRECNSLSYSKSLLKVKEPHEHNASLPKKKTLKPPATTTSQSVEDKAHGSEPGPSTGRMHKRACQILELISSEPPTKKVKPDKELSFKAARNNSSSSEPASDVPNKQIGLQCSRGLGLRDEGNGIPGAAKDSPSSSKLISDGIDSASTSKLVSDGIHSVAAQNNSTSSSEKVADVSNEQISLPPSGGFELRVEDYENIFFDVPPHGIRADEISGAANVAASTSSHGNCAAARNNFSSSSEPVSAVSKGQIGSPCSRGFGLQDEGNEVIFFNVPQDRRLGNVLRATNDGASVTQIANDSQTKSLQELTKDNEQKRIDQFWQFVNQSINQDGYVNDITFVGSEVYDPQTMPVYELDYNNNGGNFTFPGPQASSWGGPITGLANEKSNRPTIFSYNPIQVQPM